MASSLLAVQIGSVKCWHVSAGLQASDHVLCIIYCEQWAFLVRSGSLSSLPLTQGTKEASRRPRTFVQSPFLCLTFLDKCCLTSVLCVHLREGTHLPFMTKHFDFLGPGGSFRCLHGAWPPTGLPKRSELPFWCVLRDFG